MLGFFVKSNSDFSFYKKLLLRIINKCLTFDVELNDLALTTTDSIECLTGDLTRKILRKSTSGVRKYTWIFRQIKQ